MSLHEMGSLSSGTTSRAPIESSTFGISAFRANVVLPPIGNSRHSAELSATVDVAEPLPGKTTAAARSYAESEAASEIASLIEGLETPEEFPGASFVSDLQRQAALGPSPRTGDTSLDSLIVHELVLSGVRDPDCLIFKLKAYATNAAEAARYLHRLRLSATSSEVPHSTPASGPRTAAAAYDASGYASGYDARGASLGHGHCCGADTTTTTAPSALRPRPPLPSSTRTPAPVYASTSRSHAPTYPSAADVCEEALSESGSEPSAHRAESAHIPSPFDSARAAAEAAIEAAAADAEREHSAKAEAASLNKIVRESGYNRPALARMVQYFVDRDVEHLGLLIRVISSYTDPTRKAYSRYSFDRVAENLIRALNLDLVWHRALEVGDLSPFETVWNRVLAHEAAILLEKDRGTDGRSAVMHVKRTAERLASLDSLREPDSSPPRPTSAPPPPIPAVSPEHFRCEPSTLESSPPYPDAEHETAAATDGLRPIASLSWADLCREVIAAGIPEEGLSATSPWFNAQPSLDKRSAHVRLAERSIIDVIRAIAHKERRRSTRRSSEAITPKLTEDVLAKYLRNDASGRQYAQARGSLHAVLLEYRYESLLETGDYTHTMRTIIDMLLGASRRVQRLAPVQDTLATHARGQPSDGTLKILLDEIDHMLLPNSDSDDFALMTLEWHPTNVGDGCVRTAAALATQLYNLASPLYTTPADLDRTVLSYFRKAVMKARNLAGLRRDEAGLALPDKIYSTYCGRSNRATYVTAQQLIGELREPATIGTAVLRFEEEAPASRKRAADARAAAAARSVAALSLAPPLAAPAAAAFDNDLDLLYDVVEEDAVTAWLSLLLPPVVPPVVHKEGRSRSPLVRGESISTWTGRMHTPRTSPLFTASAARGGMPNWPRSNGYRYSTRLILMAFMAQSIAGIARCADWSIRTPHAHSRRRSSNKNWAPGRPDGKAPAPSLTTLSSHTRSTPAERFSVLSMTPPSAARSPSMCVRQCYATIGLRESPPSAQGQLRRADLTAARLRRVLSMACCRR